MAQQIKKKFIGDGQIDGEKIQLLKDQSIKSENQAGDVVSILQLAADNKVLVATGDSENPLGEVGTKAQVDEEKARAMLAEGNLQQAIDDEIADRILAVSTEKGRAEGEEARIEGLVTAEVTRASGEEARIEGKVDAEKTRAEAQEAAIRAEFVAADTALHGIISSEIDADVAAEAALREAADNALQSQIDNIISNTDAAALDSLSEIVAAFQSADSDLSAAITAALGTHTSELNAYKTSNDAALAAEAASRAAEDAKMLKLDGSRSMEADLSMAVVSQDTNPLSVGGSTNISIEVVDEWHMWVRGEGYQQTYTINTFGEQISFSFVEINGNVYKVTDLTLREGNPQAFPPDPNMYLFNIDFVPEVGTPQYNGLIYAGVESFSKITGLADGVDASDAVNKGQMDAALASAASDVSALQTELNRTQTGAGLGSEGEYDPEFSRIATNYIDLSVNSLYQADVKLDAQIKINENAIATEVSRAQSEEAAIRSDFAAADTALHSTISDEIDADVLVEKQRAEGVESVIANAAGLSLHPFFLTYEYFSHSDANYINGAVSLSNADKLLDAQVKTNADAISSEASRASGEESRIEGKVDQEVLDRIAADNALQNQINDIISNTDPAALDSLTEVVAAFQSADSDLSQAITDALGTHTNELNAYKTSNDARVLAAEGRLDVVEPKVSTLESEMDSAESRLDALETSANDFGPRIDTLESEMNAVEGRATTLESAMTAVEGRATTLESEMNAAEDRLAALEAVEWVSEKIIVSAAQVTAGAIDLANAPIDNSLVIFVGRLAIHETEDYAISGTTVTFAGDLASGGASPIAEGDEVYVKYQK